ncbi:fatty acid synthase-like isoform X2 [Euwallacea fornicatus]|uniref:fatty acid synthase-like isoform X2 n=1 Tax=Euwallacea fornicatus TaxID=995702 RepID=UPI00338E70C2
MAQDKSNNLENDPSIQFGKLLSHSTTPDEEIVISGMSGVFPLSDNIEEFQKNLYNKTEMISHIPSNDPEMPSGFGLLKEKNKFDAGFFDVHKKEATPLSIFGKVILEKTYECILDAGLNPSDLEGSKTGVFTGICFTEFEIHYFLVEHIKGGNTIIGNEKCAIINKISEFYKLNGPSVIVDTACSSGGFALENAFKAIRLGQCNAALVIGSNFLLSKGCSLQFARLGVLASDGKCRPFDVDGLGYVRSEATVVLLLQKAKDCKRIYANLIHTKTNCDGFKEQGITYPSGEQQYNLLKEIYLESEVNPLSVSYIEAHGTGTMVGDPEELNSIDSFFTPGRKNPLLVGSVKSSIGHSEPVATLCSIVKVILAFETDIISPNINYKTPRDNLHGIIEGRIKIVDEVTPIPDGVVGISSFGFGGANTHMVLKKPSTLKRYDRKPSDNLPRLVCVSGRTEEALNVLFDDIAEKFDEEHIALIQNIFRKPIRNHLYRGYIIASKAGVLKKSINQFVGIKTLNLYFGSLPNLPGNLLLELLNLPLLTTFKSRLSAFFNEKQLNFHALIANMNANTAQLFVNLLTQVTTCELLKQLDLKPNSVTANSLGNLAKSYFEGALSLNQYLECTSVIATLVEDGVTQKGSKGVTIEQLIQHKAKLLSEFKTILRPSGKLNGYGSHHITKDSPEELLDKILTHQKATFSFLTKSTVMLVIGNKPVFLKEKRENHIRSLTEQEDLAGVLQVIGWLFEHGQQPQIQHLYPKVQFPVSPGTPMINSTLKWKHDLEYFVPTFNYNIKKYKGGITNNIQIKLDQEKWASLDGHIIDGKILFPATSYLFLAWNAFTETNEVKTTKVIFRDCKFMKACQLNKNTSLNFEIMIQKNSGRFEILENDIVVTTGYISVYDDKIDKLIDIPKDVVNPRDDDFLESQDIYKELRLRGYNYKGEFKGLTKSNKSATYGKIKWIDNWMTFMDNMLQMKILASDTRLLYIPVGIGKIIIDPILHLQEVNKLRQGKEEVPVDVPVYVDKRSGVIRAGGIEIQDLLATSIARKKTTAVPVLEKYNFVPNNCKLPLDHAVRVLTQIALENHCGYKINAVELIDDSSDKNVSPIAQIINTVLEDQPLVHADVKIFSNWDIDTDVEVEKKELKQVENATIVIASNILSRNSILQEAMNAINENGFIITREPLSLDPSKTNIKNMHTISIIETDLEKLVFLWKGSNTLSNKQRVFINVDDKAENFEWLDQLKEEINKNQDIILWSQNQPLNGLIGLINCIRREQSSQNVRALFIIDDAPAFNPDLPFYKLQLDKKLGLNIFMNGSWGTYRHFLLENLDEVASEHCYANSTVRGDLSSIKWLEGPLLHKTVPDNDLVEVYYSSLNFRDVMTASGRISVDVITKDRREQQCVQGFEYSGKTVSGKKLMGMLSHGTLATLIKADKTLSWDVPASWSLKDAATVPVVYGTCLYALVVVGKIKPSDSVLIHSGTGGIGQAAINLCLEMGCTVFTTVGTQEKRSFIKNKFPQINEKHIGNSRDLSFEQMIMGKTNGKGVDIILNSLAEEKLLASARCLSQNGRFLEIGKFDLANNNRLNLHSFMQGGSYHGIMLDKLFTEDDSVKLEFKALFQKYLDSGAIKPLNSTVFSKNEVEQAFRFMTTGKHMGKVLVEIRNEDLKEPKTTFMVLPRYFCDPSKTYIICGGLGGFGLELADWLVLRGAKHLVLTSRKGVTTGYQCCRISIWQSYGCNIKISTEDITTRTGCEALIKEANSIAPVKAIFNLAVVLSDAILENQTKQSFQTSFGPKAHATQYLDEVTRKLCPEITDFVIFSSVSCGRGNAGQTNYGMSNSVMERICEKRHREGYPALAIQWGAIGDVGLVANLQEDHIELEIGGTLQQSISSCLQVMDTLLRQHNAVIVSSMVVAEKRASNSSKNVMEIIAELLGIKDIKSVSLHSTLAELGMDSMNAVEVKQTLEREFNLFLTPIEIRGISLSRIQELKENNSVQDINMNQETLIDWVNILKNLVESNEETSFVMKMKTKPTTRDESKLPKIIAFPGIEGVCYLLEHLTELLEVQAFGINYISEAQLDNYPKMADMLLPHVLRLLSPNEPFHFLAHSMGTVVALEVADRLEKKGYLGTITLLDGSLATLQKLCNVFMDDSNNTLLSLMLKTQLNEKDTQKAMVEIYKDTTLDEKLATIVKHFKTNEKITRSFIINSITAVIKRIKALYYTPCYGKLKSKALLAKAKVISFKSDTEDFELGQYFENLDIKVFDGNHTTLLQNQELADTIMNNLSTINGFSENH